MNLVVDRGNTCTKAAVFRAGRPVAECLVARGDDERGPIARLLDDHPASRAIVASTAGDAAPLLEALRQRVREVVVFGPGTRIPIRNAYLTPATLGADRLAAAVGAAALYPGRDVLIVDLGTALTIDFLSADATFRGGVISPGLALRFRSLRDATASLPLCTPAEACAAWFDDGARTPSDPARASDPCVHDGCATEASVPDGRARGAFDHFTPAAPGTPCNPNVPGASRASATSSAYAAPGSVGVSVPGTSAAVPATSVFSGASAAFSAPGTPCNPNVPGASRASATSSAYAAPGSVGVSIPGTTAAVPATSGLSGASAGFATPGTPCDLNAPAAPETACAPGFATPAAPAAPACSETPGIASVSAPDTACAPGLATPAAPAAPAFSETPGIASASTPDTACTPGFATPAAPAAPDTACTPGFAASGTPCNLNAPAAPAASSPEPPADPALRLQGLSTREAVEWGVVNSVVFEIEGYIGRMRARHPDLTVIFTGGDAKYLVKRIKNTIFANCNLVLSGLDRILEFHASEEHLL